MGFCVILTILSGLVHLVHIQGSLSETKHLSPRIICQDVFTAHKFNSTQICLNKWKSSRWVAYKEDFSGRCFGCKHVGYIIKSENNWKNICDPTKHHSECLLFRRIVEWTNTEKKSVPIVCNLLKYCRTHTYIGDLNFGDILCDDCKNVIDDVRKIIMDNATAEAVAVQIDGLVCANVPAMWMDYCKDTVKAHVPLIMEYIASNLDSSQVCSLIGICPAFVAAKDLPALPENMLDSSRHQPDCAPKKYSWISRPTSGSSAFWNSRRGVPEVFQSVLAKRPSCDQCEEVLLQYVATLDDSSVQAMLKKELDDKFCSRFGFLRVECEALIDSEFAQLVDNLKNVNVTKACSIGKMCGSQQKHQLDIQSQNKLPGICQVCELVFERILDLVAPNRSEEVIKAALDQVCNLFPDRERVPCINFVDTYGAQIIEAIIKGSAPKLFCTAMGLCTFEAAPVDIKPVAKPVTSTYCSMCKMVVSFADMYLRQNETETKIIDTAKDLCRKFVPSAYRPQCTNLVDDYGHIVLDYLTDNKTPEEICELIHLCDSDLRSAISCRTMPISNICDIPHLASACKFTEKCLQYKLVTHIQSMQSPTTGSRRCWVCSRLINALTLRQKLFGQFGDTSGLCDSFKIELDRQQCSEFLLKRDLIVKTLTQRGGEQNDVCTHLLNCNAPVEPIIAPTNVPLLGLNECTWGPSLWCHSEETACKCGQGAVKHCEENVWMKKVVCPGTLFAELSPAQLV